nr:L,D-transpeptidase family protein [Bradyrhizobium sp. BRP22]
MISRFVGSKRSQARRRATHLIMASLAALVAAGDDAGARGGRSERRIEAVESRIAGDPIMAIVSLQDQRIIVYDANGWILRAPVSSGQRGRETPAGIFSVIQKEAEHYSNLYDDAYMPHMQRITWSGIALHGGPLPGYPASHGCVRMPFDFAARLFEDTRLGLRVIVAPTDVAPIEIAHPALLKPKPDVAALAAARRAEADEATAKADQARLAAAKAYRESTQATMPVRVAENLKRRAETQLAAAENALGSATSPESREQAERAKAQAVTRVAELQEQWTAAKAELQPKLDAVTAAREAALAAENARIVAVEAARQATRELEPVSVLISRKTQRLYVRRAFEPILESPVTVQDADRPIGTHVFTATAQTDGSTGVRWSVVSLESGRPHIATAELDDPARRRGGHEIEPRKTEPVSAMAALDRIVIPQDVLDRIGGVTPRSSLIITDEALSSETGKGTEFVVVMSGEPQGGIKMRRRAPASEFPYARSRDRRPFWSPPFAGPFSTW